MLVVFTSCTSLCPEACCTVHDTYNIQTTTIATEAYMYTIGTAARSVQCGQVHPRMAYSAQALQHHVPTMSKTGRTREPVQITEVSWSRVPTGLPVCALVCERTRVRVFRCTCVRVCVHVCARARTGNVMYIGYSNVMYICNVM